MFINLDPKAVGIDLPLQELIALAARHGFEGIDLPLDRIGEGKETMSFEQIEDAMDEAGLKFGSFGATWDHAKDQATYDKRMVKLREWLPIAQRLGCNRGVTGARPCSDELEYDANFELHVKRLAPMARLMADHEIRLGLEFIGPKTLRDEMKYEFVHTLPQMLDLIGAITSKGEEQYVGVLLDSYHWYTSGGTADELTDLLDNQKIVLVHVNDGVAGLSRDQQMDLECQLPCATGIIESTTFIRCLKAIGYDGPVAVEPFNAELEKQTPDKIANQVIASARQMLELN